MSNYISKSTEELIRKLENYRKSLEYFEERFIRTSPRIKEFNQLIAKLTNYKQLATTSTPKITESFKTAEDLNTACDRVLELFEKIKNYKYPKFVIEFIGEPTEEYLFETYQDSALKMFLDDVTGIYYRRGLVIDITDYLYGGHNNDARNAIGLLKARDLLTSGNSLVFKQLREFIRELKELKMPDSEDIMYNNVITAANEICRQQERRITLSNRQEPEYQTNKEKKNIYKDYRLL